MLAPLPAVTILIASRSTVTGARSAVGPALSALMPLMFSPAIRIGAFRMRCAWSSAALARLFNSSILDGLRRAGWPWSSPVGLCCTQTAGTKP